MMLRKTLPALLMAGATMLASSPAQGDTRAGIDAWTRGDYPAAVKEWQADAMRGDADALFNLGQAYKLGKGVKQDLAKAESLYGRAAAMGHLQAADSYGLLLFQRGERARALPFVRAAADRGDPRAQYLLGIAHFNGDLAPKDWVRAYALVSLAQQQGLSQATTALAQMDQHIPMEQRQQAVAVAAELRSQSEATLARQLAASDLGTKAPASVQAEAPVVTSPIRPPRVASATDTVAAARGGSPASAGADYARPRTVTPAPVAVRTPAAPTPVAHATGKWRIQLGAFGQTANADALWSRVKGRAELAGHPRLDVRAGSVVKLQAGGYSSQDAARAACSRLSAGGFTCIPVVG